MSVAEVSGSPAKSCSAVSFLNVGHCNEDTRHKRVSTKRVGPNNIWNQNGTGERQRQRLYRFDRFASPCNDGR